MKVPGRRGRPPGSKNKKTLALEALASAGLDRRQQELAMQVGELVPALCTALHYGLRVVYKQCPWAALWLHLQSCCWVCCWQGPACCHR